MSNISHKGLQVAPRIGMQLGWLNVQDA